MSVIHQSLQRPVPLERAFAKDLNNMSAHLDGNDGHSVESLLEITSENASIRSSPPMEDFEIEDEDGPLLSELESGVRKNPRFCRTGRLPLTGKKNWQLLLVLAALVLISLSLIAVGVALFAGGFSKILPNSGPSSSPAPNTNSTTDPPMREGNSTLLEIGHSYVKAIMGPNDTSFPRLDCPAPTSDRYTYLKHPPRDKRTPGSQPRYFFALDLHQCVDVLPRLIGSIVETIRFLGPKDCALSIVEGRSDDGTYEVLKLLKEELDTLGVVYYFTSSEIDPGKDNSVHRISALAELRNLAIQPLVNHAENYDPNVTVVFINDVAICMEDILELIHQRVYQNADMTCAMDWTFVGPDPTFYDVWIARGMNGDSFFNIPADGNWNSAWNLFWNNPTAHQRQQAGQPFQVFSCWNGAVTFTAKPLIETNVRFRASRESECFQGEPKIWAKELWYHGFGKIAVIPSVNLEYSDEAAKEIKGQKGYVSHWVEAEGKEGLRIQWDEKPPEKVKCIPTYDNQTWPPWDEDM